MRERRPGVWEIRVVVANDEVTGRSVQRSFTVHGDADVAQARCAELVERFGVDRRALFCTGARLDLAELLERFLAGNGHWRPATRSSNTSVARFLTTDPLGSTGLAAITPAVVEAAFSRWRRQGASAALVWGRWAVLRSALSWAVTQRFLRANPLDTMRAPPRPLPRKHLLPREVATLLRTADDQVTAAEQRLEVRPTGGHALEALFVAEQTRLLVRLAADTGARRGELATLRLSDLSGRVLTIERNLSLEILGPTKTGRNRRVTLGSTTAAMVVDHFASWSERVGPDGAVGDWIFAPDYRRLTNARADLLSHRFDRLRRAAGMPDAALHRLRHSVGTQLVADGKLLKAQARLGHRDPATTLRHYAHAVPLDDLDIADSIDDMLNGVGTGPG
jgi:integrase